MLRRLEWLLVALVTLVWFAVLMPWGRFTDPDAFYHAHAASRMLDHGPLTAFPWLDLTTMGTHVANQHFLYHVTLLPAILMAREVMHGNVFAEFWATQMMAVVLATGTTLALWTMLRRIDPPRAWVWTILALLVPGFSLRMSLGKASPMAVGIFIAVVGLMALGIKDVRTKGRKGFSTDSIEKPFRPFVRTSLILLLVAGFLFALTHGGWIIAILATGMMIAGDILFQWLGRDEPLRHAITHASWIEMLALIIGIATGIAVHPNHDELFRFLWTQIVMVGIATPAGVLSGTEWHSIGPGSVMMDLAPLVIAGLIAAFGMVLAARRSATALHRAVVLAMPVALTFAMTLNSRRFIEYLAPAFALWIASLWACVDVERLRIAVRDVMRAWPVMIRRIVICVIAILAITLVTHQTQAVWSSLRREAAKPFDAWRDTMAAISRRAQPGDRVFNSSWDEFPLLFAADDRLRFVSGLDPVFLHDEHPSLSIATRDLTLGITTSTLWDVIVEQTGSRFVFVTTKRHPIFNEALRNDPRFHEIVPGEDTAAYEVTGWER